MVKYTIKFAIKQTSVLETFDIAFKRSMYIEGSGVFMQKE